MSLLPVDLTHLIVRLPNWLGDTVMALPALRTLRSHLEGRRITLVGSWAPLLAGQRVADGWVRYPRSTRGRLAAVRELRRLRADTVLLFPNSLESALTAWLWGARWILGYATDGRRSLLSHPIPPPDPRRHQVDEYLGLLAPLGIRHQAGTAPRWIAETADDSHDGRLEALLPSRAARPVPRIGIHLGAAFGPSKLWPADRIATLCRELGHRGALPVLLGSPSEQAMADEVLASIQAEEEGQGRRDGERHEVVCLVGRDAPELLPRLLARLDVLVSMDTGVAHLAAAVGVPVVALFGPTDPQLTAPRGPNACVIWKPPPCAPCFLPECPIEHPCMRAISVQEVLEAAEARMPGRG